MLYMCVFFPLHSTLLARDKSEFQMCSFFHHQFIRFDFFFSFNLAFARRVRQSIPLSDFQRSFHHQMFSLIKVFHTFSRDSFFFSFSLLINEDFFSCNRSKIHQLKITRETSGNSSLDTHCFCCSSSAIVNRRGWANLNNCTTVKNRCWKSLNFHYKFRYHSQFK